MFDDSYQLYLDEINKIIPCDCEETMRLLSCLAQGEMAAKERLVEGHLKMVLELTLAYLDQGVMHTDLIQEANLVLSHIIYEISNENVEMDADQFYERIKQRINRQLKLVIEAQQAASRLDEEIAAKVNVLEIVSQKLAKEYGRQPSVEELAATMKMTTEEIQEIMKWMLDALRITDE